MIPKDRDSFQHINDRDAIWTTRRRGYRLDEAITLLINDERRDYVVRGFVPESAQDSEDVVLMDLAAAQNATHKLGRVDRILLKVPEHPGLAVWQQKLRDVLPSGVALNSEGSQTAANRRMLSAFRWNLRILSYIALLVGAFLIYNTISVSVVRRRADIGTVRALGASRRAVLLAFVAEAAMFGLAGALIALPMGRLMATGAVRLLATTVNALYITSRPGALNLSAESVILALIAGVGVAVTSALAPAREASLVPPTEAMARGPWCWPLPERSPRVSPQSAASPSLDISPPSCSSVLLRFPFRPWCTGSPPLPRRHCGDLWAWKRCSLRAASLAHFAGRRCWSAPCRRQSR